MEKFNNKHQFVKTDRSRHIHSLGIAALALLGLATAPAALGQSYTLTTLASFNVLNGQAPQGDLTLSGSTLYGTTSGDAGFNTDGTVFSVPTTGGAPNVLATFNTQMEHVQLPG